MNDQSGFSPQSGSAVSLKPRAQVPATALQELVVGQVRTDRQHFGMAEILRLIRAWWWLIAAIVVGCVIAAAVISLVMTPKYRADSTLQVDREGMQVIQTGNMPPINVNDREFMQTQIGLLKSRDLAERVARDLSLSKQEEFANQDAAPPVKDKEAATKLRQNVSVDAVEDSRLINLQVVSTNPQLAAKIADAYGKNFIQATLERRFEATSYARNFLEQRIAGVKKRLEESERQLVAYAQRQGILNLNTSPNKEGAGNDQSIEAASLVSLNDALSQAHTDRITAEQRYRQNNQNGSTAEVLGNPAVQALTTQRAQAQAEYEEKLGLFKPDYPPLVQMRSRIAALDTAIREQSGKVAGASRSEFQAALAKEQQLQARVNQLKASVMNLRERSIEYTILQREVDTNRALYDSLLQRYKEVGVAGGVGTNDISVIDKAVVPAGPFRPNMPLNLAMGLLVGLVLGIGTAFGLEWMDDTIKSPDDVNTKLGIASLGIIPAIPKGEPVAEHLMDPRSSVSEAYQSVRAALQFSTEHGVPKSLLLTSTRASEGKSSTALALGRTLASLGASVLIIDSDLRRPTFRAPASSTEGLSTLLAGSDEVAKCIHPTEFAQLSLLPAGPIPPNPAELLASNRFERILEAVGQKFDHVIIDAPPVLGLADAPLLSSYCEGTILIIEAGAIRRGAALSALERLRRADGHIMGAVLTKFAARDHSEGYGYGYSQELYAYREGEQPKKQIELIKSA